MIDHIAHTVTHRLVDQGLLTADAGVDTISAELSRLVTDDLGVEDRLNEEVKEILRTHSQEMEQNRVDYSQMFNMVKRRLVRERGLIL
jgi:hypothetical protein